VRRNVLTSGKHTGSRQKHRHKNEQGSTHRQRMELGATAER
jgi:hypothetical protein